jgi:3-hydroxyacyl-CoA dehydrogenase
MVADIRRAVVLGANGTMGALSGGILAQYGIHVAFVSRGRDRSVIGIEKAVAQARSEQLARFMTAESYDRLPEVLRDCDWVFEALGEDLDLKRHYYEIVDRHRRDDSIVSTVSSGLSIEALAEGRSRSFKQHFLGTHFYNPPAKLPAAERIAHSETLPEVVQFVDTFMRDRLRRVVIPTRNVPAFAGNRIGFQFLNQAAIMAEQHGVLAVDSLLGPYTGRAMPPLRTIDLVGLDVHRAIVDNVFKNAPGECRDCFRMPEFMQAMIERGQLGSKTRDKGGFYGPKHNGSRPVWNPRRNEHEMPEPPRHGFVDDVRELLRDGLYREALAALFAADGEAALLVQKSLANYVHYAFSRIGDVTEVEQGISGIDDVMAFGFNWAPPGAFVDLLGGPAATSRVLEARGFTPPERLLQLPEGQPVCRISDIGRFFVAT